MIEIIGGGEEDPLGIWPSILRDDADDLNLDFYKNAKTMFLDTFFGRA